VIDLGVVEAPVGNKNLVVEACRSDNLVAIVPLKHPLAAKASVALDELMSYPFICREEGSGTREVIEEYICHAEGCKNGLNIAMELGSPEAVKGAVEAGMGISIVSEATVSKERRLETLEILELDPPMNRPFSFVHQKQKFRVRVMDELLEFARGYCNI